MEHLISDLLAYSQATKGTHRPASSWTPTRFWRKSKKNLATIIEETGAVISGADLPVVPRATTCPSRIYSRIWFRTLSSIAAEAPRIRISADELGDRWLFAVQDNGIGIPQENQKEIFGIFRRLHDRKDYPGTGIGLAICQKIVERYGGRIWVESKWPGFYILLYASQPQPPRINCGLSLDQAFADGVADQFTAVVQVQFAHQVHLWASTVLTLK